MTPQHRAAEELRRRRTARHLGLSITAVVLFGLAVAVLYWSLDRSPDPPPASQDKPAAVADRATLLIQVTTPQGAVGNVLTSVADPATTLLLPQNLVLSSRDSPPQPLRDSVAGIDTLRAAGMVASTLGVRVDASWRLDRKALAGLVDAVGGVAVSPPRRRVLRDDQGQAVLRVRPGRQRLSGSPASWYAVGQVRGEDAADAAVRFADVLRPTLARLPKDESAIREALTALGALSPSTVSTQALSRLLVDLSAGMAGGGDPVRLPVTTIGRGPGSLAWTDYDSATPLLRQQMRDSLWLAGGDVPPRVLVAAASGPPGRIMSTRSAVQDAGFVWVDGRGTPAAARARSSIQVRGDPRWGRVLADALDLPRSVISGPARPGPLPLGRPWADVDIVLGRDYRPR